MEPSADLLTKWQGWQQGTHSLAQAVSNTPHPSASEARAGGSVRTFSSGSAYSRNQDTTACPLSCVATTRRSSLLMTCTQRRRRGRERRTRGCLYKSRCCSLQAAHVPAYLSHTAPKAAPSCRFKTDDRNLLAAAPGPAACCLVEREKCFYSAHTSSHLCPPPAYGSLLPQCMPGGATSQQSPPPSSFAAMPASNASAVLAQHRGADPHLGVHAAEGQGCSKRHRPWSLRAQVWPMSNLPQMHGELNSWLEHLGLLPASLA